MLSKQEEYQVEVEHDKYRLHLGFNEVVRKNKEMIINTIKTFEKEDFDIDELYQISLIKLWQYYEKKKGKVKFTPGLAHFIAKTETLGVIKHKGTKKSKSTFYCPGDTMESIEDEYGVLPNMDDENKLLTLNQIITRLPDDQKSFIVCYLDNDLSLKRTALQLHKHHRSSSRILSEIIQTLRKNFAINDDDLKSTPIAISATRRNRLKQLPFYTALEFAQSKKNSTWSQKIRASYDQKIRKLIESALSVGLADKLISSLSKDEIELIATSVSGSSNYIQQCRDVLVLLLNFLCSCGVIEKDEIIPQRTKAHTH